MLLCCPPTVKNRRTQPIQPWMSRGLLVSRKIKDKLHYKAMKSSNNEKWLRYKDYRNLYTKLVRKAEILYYGNEFQLAKNNVRDTWRLSNEVLGRSAEKGNNEVGPIRGCQTQIETAECFNNFYCNIAQQLADKIPRTNVSFKSYLPKIDDSVKELDLSRSVDELSIELLIRKMKGKRSFSHDSMSNYALKAVRQLLLKPLSHLISLSLKLGHVPKDWKKAKLIPIYKNKGEKDEMTDYIQRMPKFSIAQVWNKHVPKSIKDLPEASFNLAYKNHFLNEYVSFNCNIPNCYNCESRFIR